MTQFAPAHRDIRQPPRPVPESFFLSPRKMKNNNNGWWWRNICTDFVASTPLIPATFGTHYRMDTQEDVQKELGAERTFETGEFKDFHLLWFSRLGTYTRQ